MADTLPMLEHDPRDPYRTSRILRVLLFSFVAAVVCTLILIATVRFVWDQFISEMAGGGTYQSRPVLIVPAMLLIAAIFGKLLWDQAEGRVARPRK